MPRLIALAKLTQPRISGVAGRYRLHTQLKKELSNYPVVWVAGPAGATFFYYMGLAGQTAAKRKRQFLSLLTPEYLSDLPGFAHRFFS